MSIDTKQIDWTDFDAIFDHCLTMWPVSVTLSAARGADGERLDFASWDFDEQIDGPYFERNDHKHIVRVMLWAMFCALPRETFSGPFALAKLDKAKVRAKFERDIRSAQSKVDATPEEEAYFHHNMT